MRTIKSIITKLSKNTFGYDTANFTEIYFDNVLFSNAAELVVIDDDFSMQPNVCEECGISGCNVDGHYNIRKFGDNAIFICESSKSFFVVNVAQFEMLNKLIGVLPALALAPNVTAHEMVNLVPLLAPPSLLETLSDRIRFKRNAVLTTSTENDDETYQALQYELDNMFNNHHPITLQSTDQVPITFFLEDFPAKDWEPLVKIDNQYFIYLGSGYYIKRD